MGLTGFLRPGVNEESHRTYGERIQRLHEDGKYQPNLIIFQGGLNDSRYESGELQQSVQDTLKMTKGFWPDAQIVLIGPITYRTSLGEVNGAYSQGAYVAGVPYVDANRFPIIPRPTA
ncbi:SGNH/GDSL hydrolase family protein [Rhodococcus opacus]|nr:SGNH/GDSL hydrolase family protein [Rhodococcus opacus]